MGLLRSRMIAMQAWVDGLSVSTKRWMATAAVALVALAPLAAMAPFAAPSGLVSLVDGPLDAEQSDRVASFLEDRGVRFQTLDDRVMVPLERRTKLLAELQLTQVLPFDVNKSRFDILVEQQSWWREAGQPHPVTLREASARSGACTCGVE